MTSRFNQEHVPSPARRLAADAGVTLVELMAATVISMIVIGAGFTALIASNKATQINDLVANTQQNVRLAMELLARDIKLAGFGMTGPVGACTINGAAVPIVPGDNNTAGADTGPDTITMVVPNSNTAIAPFWTLAAQAQGPFTNIVLQTGAVTDMDNQAGGGGALVGMTVSVGGAVSTNVQAINAGTDTITLVDQVGAPKIFPAQTQVYLLECVTYSIGTTVAGCGGNAPCLLRSVNGGAGVPLVEGIEDIQFGYACDGCNVLVNGGNPDGIPDDQNATGTFDVGDFITNNTWAVDPMTPRKIKLVEVNIVAIQSQQVGADSGISEANRVRQITTPGPVIVSDHDPSADAGYNLVTYQVNRRRVLTRTIETRNVGP